MLSLELQNRIDLLFAHAVIKDVELLKTPSVIADSIFEQVQPKSGSLYYKDVEARCKILALRNSSESFGKSSSSVKNGRPKKWHFPLITITIPREFAPSLVEIALEWQQNKLDDMPF